jgi:hypothetical protein
MISKDKTYRTRDGREVRIYATETGPNNFYVHGAIKKDNGWDVCSWGNNGRRLQCDEHMHDLIEVKPRIKRTVWLNVYRDRVKDGVHERKGEADYHADKNRLACVRVEIDCEEGEGL